MKIFKFGGASVKDADGVRNVAKVLQSQGFAACVLVVSAMGKTTNALEDVVGKYLKKENYQAAIRRIESQHLVIAQELFPIGHEILGEISMLFSKADSFLATNESESYNFIYDQVVSCGELVSSKILSEFLNENGFENIWLDARDFIKTDSNFREGNVQWMGTESGISNLNKASSYVTQGFIGADAEGNTVTLGREGSDYSAAIFAYATDATEMTIWKDVPGVMTGDPRKFGNVALLTNISYEEAIEMAYYGATVIHPKTLQPLKQKNIPFFVKSFLEPEKPGTKVGSSDLNELRESYILKENQILMKISTRDFSFIAEEHLSLIFSNLAKFKIKISLMRNTAISLELCVEDKYSNIERLNDVLKSDFNTSIIKNVSLFTIRNADLQNIQKFAEGKKILLEQASSRTFQMVTYR